MQRDVNTCSCIGFVEGTGGTIPTFYMAAAPPSHTTGQRSQPTLSTSCIYEYTALYDIAVIMARAPRKLKNVKIQLTTKGLPRASKMRRSFQHKSSDCRILIRRLFITFIANSFPEAPRLHPANNHTLDTSDRIQVSIFHGRQITGIYVI